MGISSQEALDLFDSDDLIGIGMAANEVRRIGLDPALVAARICGGCGGNSRAAVSR